MRRCDKDKGRHAQINIDDLMSASTKPYGSKPLEFAKGKNAIELGSEAEVADVLAKVREAAEHGELDALIEKQAQFGRRVTQKNK